MVTIVRYPMDDDWARCYALAVGTEGKTSVKIPDQRWRERMLACEHSPIRTLMFTIAVDMPYYVSVHFARHKYGVEHYVQSQRNDRQDKYDRREAPQGATVMHLMDINAQALINMAHRRLCGKADPATQEVMREIVREVVSVCPEFESALVPMCIYRGNKCHEMKPCGRYK